MSSQYCTCSRFFFSFQDLARRRGDLAYCGFNVKETGSGNRAAGKSTSKMAEYSQLGLLAALLLFTVLTLRDVYVGKSSSQQFAAGSEMEPGRAAKAAMYVGPVLKFQYW